MEVLQLYEKYQTSDVDEKLMKKSSSKLMKGEKLITPMSIFRPLSLMTPEIVRECCPKILTGSMKLEDLISESTQVSKQRTKEGLVMKITGFKSIELLRCQFPNKFTTDILDKLSNTPEPKPNPAGGGRVDASQLESYTKSLVNNARDEACSLPPENSLIKIEIQSDVKELNGLISRAKSERVKHPITKVVLNFESELSVIEKQKQNFNDEYSTSDLGRKLSCKKRGRIV